MADDSARTVTADVEKAPYGTDPLGEKYNSSFDKALGRGYIVNGNKASNLFERGFPLGKQGFSSRRQAAQWDFYTSVILACLQVSATAVVFAHALNDWGSKLGLTNVAIVLMVCSIYRFFVHIVGPFIREDVVMWNRFVSRMIFPNVATIVIWFIFLQPATIDKKLAQAANINITTYPNFLIPDLDFALATVAMLV